MPTYSDLLDRHFEKVSFGGYRAADVDSYMAELKVTLSQSGREAAELRRKLEAAEKKIQGYENDAESLKSTLLNAQKLADRIVKEAQEKADLTLQQAQEKADLLLGSARIKAEDAVDSVQREIELRKEEAARIKQEVSDFKLNVMHLYKAHLELINGIPSEEPPARPAQEEIEDIRSSSEEDGFSEEQPAQADSVETPVNPPEQAEETAFEQAAVTAAPAEQTQQQETAEEMPQQPEEQIPVIQPVKLNLKYNEKTGEYEPITQPQNDDGKSRLDRISDGLKFGADYNIRTDSFDDGSGRRPWRK